MSAVNNSLAKHSTSATKMQPLTKNDVTQIVRSIIAEEEQRKTAEQKEISRMSMRHISQFLDLQGLSRVGNSDVPKYRRIAWLIIVGVLFVLTGFMVAQRLLLYANKPTITTIRHKRNSTLRLPVPVVCVMAERVANKSLEHVTNTSVLQTIWDSKRMKWRHFNYLEKMHYTYKRACFIGTEVELVNTYDALSMTVYMPHRPNEINYEISFELVNAMPESSNAPFLQLWSATSLNPYAHGVLSIDVRVEERHMLPHSECVGGAESQPVRKCRRRCLKSIIERNTNVSEKVLHQLIADLNWYIAPLGENMTDVRHELYDAFDKIKSESMYCEHCKEPCTEVSYVTRSFLREMDTERTYKSGYMTVDIYVRAADMRILHFVERLQFEWWTDYLSDLGGTMGVLVGGCLVTLLQIIDIVVAWIYHTTVKWILARKLEKC